MSPRAAKAARRSSFWCAPTASSPASGLGKNRSAATRAAFVILTDWLSCSSSSLYASPSDLSEARKSHLSAATRSTAPSLGRPNMRLAKATCALACPLAAAWLYQNSARVLFLFCRNSRSALAGNPSAIRSSGSKREPRLYCATVRPGTFCPSLATPFSPLSRTSPPGSAALM